MNILVSTNRKYIEPLKIMLRSLKETNNDEIIDVFLLYSNLNTEDIIQIEKFIKEIKINNLYPLYVNPEIMADWPLCSNLFSVEVYTRVISHLFLPNKLDRILWLDADIVILDDISLFYNQAFDEKSIVVVADANCHTEHIISLKKELSLPSEHVYFNSGVILFNLNKIRSKITFDGVANTLNMYKDKLCYPDQDLLNILYQNDFKLTDNIFNYQVFNHYTDNYNIEWIRNNVYILHYTGLKPWDYHYTNKIKVIYWEIKKNYISNISYYIYNIKNKIYSFKLCMKNIIKILLKRGDKE